MTDVADEEPTCPTCAAGLLGDVCPSCPLDVDPTAPTIPIPSAVLRERFRESGWPPPLESSELDEWAEVDGETPTSPETPLAKKSEPPGGAS